MPDPAAGLAPSVTPPDTGPTPTTNSTQPATPATGAAAAYAPAPTADTATAASATTTIAPKLSAEELKKLLGPIALYPDVLVAQILPAATYPLDVVQAARWVASKSYSKDKIDAQPWDASVKALAHYPDVLKMMDEKLDWTTQLGQVFLNQPDEALEVVQGLRTQAQAAGSLTDNNEQKVIVEKETIRIVPSDPQVVYVPRYDPQVVYVQQPYTTPGYYYNDDNVLTALLSFGTGMALGAWLTNDINWSTYNVHVYNDRSWWWYDRPWWNNRSWYDRPCWWDHRDWRGRRDSYIGHNAPPQMLPNSAIARFPRAERQQITNNFSKLNPQQRAAIVGQLGDLNKSQQTRALSYLKNGNVTPASATAQPVTWKHDTSRASSLTNPQISKLFSPSASAPRTLDSTALKTPRGTLTTRDEGNITTQRNGQHTRTSADVLRSLDSPKGKSLNINTPKDIQRRLEPLRDRDSSAGDQPRRSDSSISKKTSTETGRRSSSDVSKQLRESAAMQTQRDHSAQLSTRESR
ncbi:MAG: DUF3300 domain-containing protein, partial [bacterium]